MLNGTKLTGCNHLSAMTSFLIPVPVQTDFYYKLISLAFLVHTQYKDNVQVFMMIERVAHLRLTSKIMKT